MPKTNINKQEVGWEKRFEELFDEEMRDENGVFPNENETRGGVEIVRNVFIPFIQTELSSQKERLVEQLSNYIEHTKGCIRSQWSTGEPTKNGGYRMKFGDKWYESRPVDKTPKCDCGLDAELKLLKQDN